MTEKTAHDLSQFEGVDMTQLGKIPLVDVNRSHEPVPGGLALFPGNRMIAYHPSRDMAYGGTVFVDVTYNGESLSRSSFSIRALPTFVHGMLADSLSQALGGIDVSLPELGRTVTSDSNGNFNFGFGDQPDKTLPAGRQRLVFNPGMKNPRFGTLERWVDIEAGRLTRLGSTLLPILNPDVPFIRIDSDQSEARLAASDLLLDLSQANLLFPNGRTGGDVHVQFLSRQQISFQTLRSAIPAWVYGVQPAGVEVSGQLQLTMNAPTLYGTHSYLPETDSYVVLVGLDPRSMQIVPVGVGQISGTQISSVGQVHLQRLDYIGYALVPTSQQAILAEYANGSLSISRLIGQLEASVQ